MRLGSARESTSSVSWAPEEASRALPTPVQLSGRLPPMREGSRRPSWPWMRVLEEGQRRLPQIEPVRHE